MRNSRGDLGDYTMVFAFLFLLVIIGVGIALGVYIFFGSGYDFRIAEAEILNFKVRKCIINNEINSDNFYESCKLDKNIVDKYNLIRICKNSVECINDRDPLIGEGSRFQACKFEGGKENENFPKCVIKSFKKGKDNFEVITGSLQDVRRLLG